MLGQIFLGRQVAPQGSKLSSWEFSMGWPSTLHLYVPNSINSFFVPQFYNPATKQFFWLTTILPKSHDITWLNLKYHVTWPSTVYRIPSVQLHPKQMYPVKHSEMSLLCSKKVNLTISWPHIWMTAALLLEGLTLMWAALPPASMVGTRTGSHLRICYRLGKSRIWQLELYLSFYPYDLCMPSSIVCFMSHCG